MTNPPKLVLHIGTEKTGTTTIQNFFRLNRDEFQSHSVLYPTAPGSPNHLKLSAFADADHISGDIFAELGIRDAADLDRYRSDFRKKFVSELEGANFHTLVLSNEHCHSRFQRPEEVRRLRDLLADISEDIQIIVYFRRQDRLATSFQSTTVKFGAAQTNIFPELEDGIPYYYDFLSIFENWSKVFGKRNVCVRRFDQKNFKGGLLVRDFVETAGLAWSDDFKLPKKMNASLEPKAQFFLSEFNRFVPKVAGNALNPNRKGLIRIFERHFSGLGLLPSRTQAREFYSHFAESNKRLERELSPGDPAPLFDEDFSEYPEEENTIQLDFAAAVEIASVLWNEKCVESNHLRAENCYLKAQLAQYQGRPEEALHHAKKALELIPGESDFVRFLATLCLEVYRPEEALRFLKDALASNPGCCLLQDQIQAVEERLYR